MAATKTPLDGLFKFCNDIVCFMNSFFDDSGISNEETVRARCYSDFIQKVVHDTGRLAAAYREYKDARSLECIAGMKKHVCGLCSNLNHIWNTFKEDPTLKESTKKTVIDVTNRFYELRKRATDFEGKLKKMESKATQEFDSAQKNPVNEGSTAELGNFRSQQRKETGTSVENQESLGNEGASLSYQQAQDPSTTYAIYTESAQRQSANHAPHATSQEQYTPRTTETYSARFHPTDSYRQAAPNIYGEAYQGLYEYQQAQNIQYQQRHSINAHRATYSHASHYRAGSPRAYYDKQPHRMARAQYPSCRYENDQVWYVSHSGYSQAKDEPYAYKPVQKREDGHVMGEVIEDESRLLPAPEHMKKSVKNDYKAFGDHKGSRRTRRL